MATLLDGIHQFLRNLLDRLDVAFPKTAFVLAQQVIHRTNGSTCEYLPDVALLFLIKCVI